MRKLLLIAIGLLFVGSAGIASAKALDPYPAPRTAHNVYSKLANDILRPPDQYLQPAYVHQLMAQVVPPSSPNDTIGVWEGQSVTVQPTTFARAAMASVLSADTSTAEKWVDVNLTTQTLRAMEGDKAVYTMLISSGVPWHPTPVGTYHVWLKVRDQTMSGGSKEAGDYYSLPHVHNISYFYGGYSLHAAYWHHNFGHPMSHGCINMTEADAAIIFNWDSPSIPDGANSLKATDDNPGTRVVVHT